MATAKEYFQIKLAKFGFELDEVEIDIELGKQGVSGSDTVVANDMRSVELAIAESIPELLLMPEVSEGQLSKKYNIDGIKAYYSLLCSKLGIQNKLDSQPKIRNRSNLW
ncbi:hypothetical protein QM480_06480 [Flectobacillus sp. DC10W]|uniref:Uncharacterized protein n=1 Tax=Flectobacillus longus TaxID=2984207 RepID=A0ABT6YK56_9BACT|nr:DUF6706 family protein [Flectobacillus longus]MDI9863961.1 hypothetical protein [Flectobacillus longus]